MIVTRKSLRHLIQNRIHLWEKGEKRWAQIALGIGISPASPIAATRILKTLAVLGYTTPNPSAHKSEALFIYSDSMVICDVAKGTVEDVIRVHNGRSMAYEDLGVTDVSNRRSNFEKEATKD